MSRRLWVSIAILSPVLLSGCAQPAVVSGAEETQAAVALVQADVARFSQERHPLRNTDAGAVIDSVSVIDGSWGSYQRDGSGLSVRETWTVITFNTADGSFVQDGVTEESGRDDSSDFTYRGDFRAVASNRIERTVREARLGGGGAVNVSAHAGGTVNHAQPFESLITIDGDYMMLVDSIGGRDPAEYDADETEANTTLWVRIH